MNVDLDNPINTYLTFDKSTFKDKPLPSSDFSTGIRLTMIALGILGFGTFMGLGIYELKNRQIYMSCLLGAGIFTAIFYNAVCPHRIRKHVNFYLGVPLVLAIFVNNLYKANPLSVHDNEIGAGIISVLLGFFSANYILNKTSLTPTEVDQSSEPPEHPENCYPMFFPNTRALQEVFIMLSWYGVVSLGMGSLYAAKGSSVHDYWSNIGVYSDGVASLIGGFAGLVGTLFAINGIEKFEKYYETLESPSTILKGTQVLLRSATTIFSLFSPIITGSLLYVHTSLYSGLHTESEIRERANSALSFTIMMIVGAVFLSQTFLQRRELENPLSMSNRITRVEQKKACCNFQKGFLKTCKKVIDFSLPFICLIGMMIAWAVILGKTHSDQIKNAGWGMQAAFIVSAVATYILARQPFEENPRAGLMKEWLVKCANELRLTARSQVLFNTFFTYFYTKFPLNNRSLRSASTEKLIGITTGLILFALAYAQCLMQFRGPNVSLPDANNLALMMLGQGFTKEFFSPGNHT